MARPNINLHFLIWIMLLVNHYAASAEQKEVMIHVSQIETSTDDLEE